MSAIFLVLFFCLYFCFLLLIQKFLFGWAGKWRFLIYPFFWYGMFHLLVIDEIIGEKQFKKLCQDPNNYYINWDKIRGKEVYDDTISDYLIGYAIPIYHQYTTLHDMETNEEYGFYNFYSASGGWFARRIGSSYKPVSFEGYTECHANYPQKLYELNHVTSTLRTLKRKDLK
ncbi:hypothetical protein [Stenoxybacter acetivorans]|uniref:hypothetical protein n=1 Tax=Stenoxybacter acetivorans TaxID=422441 RepID=UPI00056D93B1|nr:hypothetical protein [Stenoxybacter acetivorans]